MQDRFALERTIDTMRMFERNRTIELEKMLDRSLLSSAPRIGEEERRKKGKKGKTASSHRIKLVGLEEMRRMG